MQESIKDFLENKGIIYDYHEHEPLFSCEQAKKVNVPGIISKTLFLKDNKGKYHMLILEGNKRLDSKAFSKKVEAKKIRFARPEELEQKLELKPGSVSPLGLLNDKENINVYIDEDVWDAQVTSFHPNDNTKSLVFKKEMFHKLMNAFNNKKEIIKI